MQKKPDAIDLCFSIADQVMTKPQHVFIDWDMIPTVVSTIKNKVIQMRPLPIPQWLTINDEEVRCKYMVLYDLMANAAHPMFDRAARRLI
jgi:hypothetical protein